MDKVIYNLSWTIFFRKIRVGILKYIILKKVQPIQPKLSTLSFQSPSSEVMQATDAILIPIIHNFPVFVHVWLSSTLHSFQL